MKPIKSGFDSMRFNLFHIREISKYIGYPQIGIILLKVKESSFHDKNKNTSENCRIFDEMYLDLSCSVNNLYSVKTRLNTKRMFTILVNYLDCATVVDESWVSIAIIAKNCFRRFNSETEEEGSHE